MVPSNLGLVAIEPETNSERMVGSISLLNVNPRCDIARDNEGKDAII